MGEIKLTKHAEQRAKERCGYNKKSAYRIAKKVYETGIRAEDTKGSVRTWLIDRQLKHPENEEIRLYGDKAWMFTNSNEPTLLTILQIPTELRYKVKQFCKE